MSEIKLLPCPFCGGEASISNNACKKGDTWLWSIECVDCGAFMNDEYDFHVINRWNTRKPMEQIVERLEGRKAFYKERLAEQKGTNDDVGHWACVKSYTDAIEIVRTGGEESKRE